jgi:hypothetical protein
LSADDAKAPTAAPEQPSFELLDGDRVVFLGNTLIERMQRYGYVEAALTARWPDRNITFRNLGWSGDTVWAESRGLFDSPEKGYERMIEHVGEVKPTVIFVGYGNVEAFAGKARLPAFVRQYEKLLDDLTVVSAGGARFVVIDPLPMETVAPKSVDVEGYNAAAMMYASAIQAIAARHGHRHVDMVEYVSAVNRFRASGDLVRAITTNGIHVNEFGYEHLASHIAFDLGLHDDNRIGIGFDEQWQLVGQHGCTVGAVVRVDNGVKFDLTPTRPAMVFVVVRAGAAKSSIVIRAGGRVFQPDWTTTEKNTTYSFSHHPVGVDYGTLRRAIVEKNRLYFQRWRPQNVTYIELFRKHEQGRFTEEAAVYDRLITEKEREIAELRKPITRTYELIRVKPDEQRD